MPEVAAKAHPTAILDGLGHWNFQEDPAEFNAALLGFLAEAGVAGQTGGTWARLVSNQRPLACEASHSTATACLNRRRFELQSRIPDLSVRLVSVVLGRV
jgi:hypothetical protein